MLRFNALTIEAQDGFNPELAAMIEAEAMRATYDSMRDAGRDPAGICLTDRVPLSKSLWTTGHFRYKK
ncbi:MAG: hypothetical protein LC749_21150 [Actinobacteria bacterium]|nr:hypothetical protein [Actinomycetota bacterium]